MFALFAVCAACATTHGAFNRGLPQFTTNLTSVSASALQIAGAPDGSLWYTNSSAVVHVTIHGKAHVYVIPGPNPVLSGIVVGSSGTWFTEFASEKVGRIVSYTLKERDLSEGLRPMQVAVDLRGDAWVTMSADQRADAQVAEFFPDGGSRYFALPSVTEIAGLDKPLAVDPQGIAACRSGVWFAETADSRIGRISPGGQILRFPLPSRFAQPYRIACASDGSVWFTEVGIGKLAHMDVTGHVVEIVVRGRPRLQSIAIDSAGRPWFTDRANRSIQWVDERERIHHVQMPGDASPIDITTAGDGLWVSTLHHIFYLPLHAETKGSSRSPG